MPVYTSDALILRTYKLGEADRIVVKGRIKTVPQKQWLVGRELRKRIAKLLRERNIQHVPPRQMNLVVEKPLAGRVSPAHPEEK